MIHIDSKITVWDRFSIDDEHKDALMEFLKENPVASASDITDWASDNDIVGDHDTLVDTGEELTPASNGGEATLEVIQGEDRLFDNKPVV